MQPGANTTLHSHAEDDESLSAVFYVQVPENSGELIIHTGEGLIHHSPRESQWVFFSSQTPHEVSQNLSGRLRLSVAFNLGLHH
jgi:hypothetical protein